MSAARIPTILAAIAVLTALAAERAVAWDRLERQMDAWVQERIRKARAECARKFDIARLPANDIDFIARDGNDKWGAFKDCVLGGLGLDPQHLPSPPAR